MVWEHNYTGATVHLRHCACLIVGTLDTVWSQNVLIFYWAIDFKLCSLDGSPDLSSFPPLLPSTPSWSHFHAFVVQGSTRDLNQVYAQDLRLSLLGWGCLLHFTVPVVDLKFVLWFLKLERLQIVSLCCAGYVCCQIQSHKKWLTSPLLFLFSRVCLLLFSLSSALRMCVSVCVCVCVFCQQLLSVGGSVQ